MHRDRHFTDYARKVAAADAGRAPPGNDAPGLPETPDFEALRQTSAPPPPKQKTDRSGDDGLVGDARLYLDPERRNRDFGGYRPAIGEYADPAEHGAEWQGKTPPPGQAPKP